MLSARHHVRYWILSVAAALVYQGMVTGLGFHEGTFRIILIPLMGFAIYIIWNGPGHLSSEWHLHQQAATGGLMVCLGSVSCYLDISDASAEQVKPVFHTLLAFSAIAALEAIRQNRKDIQPCIFAVIACDFDTGISPLGWNGLFSHMYSHAVVLLLFCGIYFVLALGLASIYGPEVSEEIMHCIYVGATELCSNSLVLMYALIPLTDAAVTIFYQIHRHVYPRLVPDPKPLIGTNEEWRLLKSSAADSFIRWTIISLAVSISRWRGFMPQAKAEIQTNSTWIGPESL